VKVEGLIRQSKRTSEASEPSDSALTRYGGQARAEPFPTYRRRTLTRANGTERAAKGERSDVSQAGCRGPRRSKKSAPSTTRTCDLLVRRLMQVSGLVGSSCV